MPTHRIYKLLNVFVTVSTGRFNLQGRHSHVYKRGWLLGKGVRVWEGESGGVRSLMMVPGKRRDLEGGRVMRPKGEEVIGL
jgi:hypothetical protein